MIHDELHTLVGITRSYLLQELSSLDWITSNRETVDFFKKTHKQKAEPAVKTKPPVRTSPHTAPAVRPLPPPPKAIEKKEPVKPVETGGKTPPQTPKKESVFGVLSRPVVRPEKSHLEDIGSALGQTALRPPDMLEPYSWKKSYPQCVFVSLFSPGSESDQLIHKMAEAVNSRLQQAVQILQPDLLAASDSIAYAAAETLNAIIVAFDPIQMPKALAWLAHFSQNSSEVNPHAPLTHTHSLYQTPIYQLQLKTELTNQEKSILWKALQQILLQKSS